MLTRLKKKASQSHCRCRVSAVGFNRKGEVLAYTTNRPRFSRYQGSIHAEMALMSQFGPELHTIVIIRVGKSGELKPMDPCDKCVEVAKSLGIKIRTVEALK